MRMNLRLFAIGVASVFVFGSGCERTPRPKNLVLITLDTCRADRLGPYGYAAAKTPTIDGLAREGTLYERAYAVVPETLPAHASMLTGLYPPGHGVRLNLVYRLPEEARTLAEILGEQGFHTAAVTSAAVLDRRFGLDQGFDAYDDPRKDKKPERRAQVVTERSLSMIDEAKGKRFFLWAHYYDPHSPFDPPEPFEAPEGTPAEDPRLYDLEIAYADHWIGRLLDGLKLRKLLDETVVVFTADHGESLGEHGETYHTLFVYDSTMHVPLIVTGPGIAAGKRVREIASSVDVFATALGLLRIEAPESSSRILPGLPVNGSAPREVAYGESMTPPLRYGWGALQSIRTDGWTYIRAPREELYALGADLEEDGNHAQREKERLAELRELLEDTVDRMPDLGAQANARHRPSEEETEALRALGYVGGDSGADPGDAPVVTGPDPKDMVEIAEAYQLGRLAMRLDKPDVAVNLLDWAATADPGNFGVRIELGRVYFQTKKFEEARQTFEEALEIRPDSWEVLTDLAAVEQELGHVDEAAARLEKAVSSTPFPVSVWRRLARLRLRAQDFEGAADAFRKIVELDPKDDRAKAALAKLEERREGGIEAPPHDEASPEVAHPSADVPPAPAE